MSDPLDTELRALPLADLAPEAARRVRDRALAELDRAGAPRSLPARAWGRLEPALLAGGAGVYTVWTALWLLTR